MSGTSEHTSGHGGAGHTAGNGDAEPAPGKLEIREPPPSQERPPLPNRREQQSYLRPELRQAPVLTRPIPGHSPNLLADLQLGRAAGEEEAPKLTNPDQQPPRANEQDTEGDKGTWPTI